MREGSCAEGTEDCGYSWIHTHTQPTHEPKETMTMTNTCMHACSGDFIQSVDPALGMGGRMVAITYLTGLCEAFPGARSSTED